MGPISGKKAYVGFGNALDLGHEAKRLFEDSKHDPKARETLREATRYRADKLGLGTSPPKPKPQQRPLRKPKSKSAEDNEDKSHLYEGTYIRPYSADTGID